jgi:hypothetical protein
MPQPQRADSPAPAPPSRLVRAWLLTGVSDGVWASVLAIALGSTVVRLWQGVASVVLGPRALEGGAATALVGVAMHFGVALGWSAVFLLLYNRSAALRRATATARGATAVGAIYGPAIWMVMSLAVIPLLVHRAPHVTPRWFLELAAHAVFVGQPIVHSIRSRAAGLVGRATPAAA